MIHRVHICTRCDLCMRLILMNIWSMATLQDDNVGDLSNDIKCCAYNKLLHKTEIL